MNPIQLPGEHVKEGQKMQAKRAKIEFETNFESVLKRIDSIEPKRYARTRNYLDGDVTYLSPYISRGVISTKFVLERTLERGFEPHEIEKFIQELLWREYWQKTWISRGDDIDRDLRYEQSDVRTFGVPVSLIEGRTGITAVDDSIKSFMTTGYMHNHMRLYVAAIACNIARCRWREPANWMYHYLLDGDWASNALSWQWVAGTNSSKKYYANQQNINRYCRTSDTGTFLDVTYGEFEEMDVPGRLQDVLVPDLSTPLPTNNPVELEKGLPTLVYNYYNIDPNWRTEMVANRVLLLEPSTFAKYPVGARPIRFALDMASEIKGIQVFVGEFSELQDLAGGGPIYFKEHPLNNRYRGIQDEREWISEGVDGEYRSFFAFWKRCSRLPGVRS